MMENKDNTTGGKPEILLIPHLQKKVNIMKLNHMDSRKNSENIESDHIHLKEKT